MAATFSLSLGDLNPRRFSDATLEKPAGGTIPASRPPKKKCRLDPKETLRRELYDTHAVVHNIPMQTLRMFIDGQWSESEDGATFDAYNPATLDPLARLAQGTRADAARAVEAADRARAVMARMSV